MVASRATCSFMLLTILPWPEHRQHHLAQGGAAAQYLRLEPWAALGLGEPRSGDHTALLMLGP